MIPPERGVAQFGWRTCMGCRGYLILVQGRPHVQNVGAFHWERSTLSRNAGARHTTAFQDAGLQRDLFPQLVDLGRQFIQLRSDVVEHLPEACGGFPKRTYLVGEGHLRSHLAHYRGVPRVDPIRVGILLGHCVLPLLQWKESSPSLPGRKPARRPPLSGRGGLPALTPCARIRATSQRGHDALESLRAAVLCPSPATRIITPFGEPIESLVGPPPDPLPGLLGASQLAAV